MRRGLRSNLLLLAAVVILVAIALYEPGIEPAKKAPALLPFGREAIEQITLERSSAETLQMARHADGRWWLESPIRYPLSDYRIDSLLAIAELKSLSSFPAQSDALQRYGLAEPQVRITLNGSEKLLLGKQTPLDARRYLLYHGTIHLVNDTLYYHLIGHYSSYLESRLLPTSPTIRRLHLPQLTLQLGDSGWQSTPAGADSDAMAALIEAWRNARAIQVQPYDGREGEAITVTTDATTGEAAAEEGEEVKLLLTATEPELILARPDLGIQYRLDAAAGRRLLTLQPVQKDLPQHPAD